MRFSELFIYEKRNQAMKITKSQLRRIIKEEVREAKMYSGPGQNAGLATGEEELSQVSPDKLQKNYENGLSQWITRQIIDNKIDQEEVHYYIEEWREANAYAFGRLTPEAVESIIDKGIVDAFRHSSEVP
jgi:hypothetical protein